MKQSNKKTETLLEFFSQSTPHSMKPELLSWLDDGETWNEVMKIEMIYFLYQKEDKFEWNMEWTWVEELW